MLKSDLQIEAEVYEGDRCVYAPMLSFVPRVGDEIVVGIARRTFVVKRVRGI